MLSVSFDEKTALLVDVTPRSEVHGAEREPAADLKFRVKCDGDVLAEFHSTLRSFLYFKDKVAGNDLVNQANDAPNLRMPKLVTPLKWDDEMTGSLKIHHGIGGKSDITLDPVRVNNWQIEPHEGGTVAVTFRVQCHPDEKAIGHLALQVQQEVSITLTPTEAK